MRARSLTVEVSIRKSPQLRHAEANAVPEGVEHEEVDGGAYGEHEPQEGPHRDDRTQAFEVRCAGFWERGQFCCCMLKKQNGRLDTHMTYKCSSYDLCGCFKTYACSFTQCFARDILAEVWPAWEAGSTSPSLHVRL